MTKNIEMTSSKKLRKNLFAGALALTMSMGMVGCSSEKKPENNNGNQNSNMVEVDPNSLTDQEVSVLKSGDRLEGKNISSELLDKYDLDIRYVYDVYSAPKGRELEYKSETYHVDKISKENLTREYSYDGIDYCEEYKDKNAIVIYEVTEYKQEGDAWYKYCKKALPDKGHTVTSQDKIQELSNSQKKLVKP